MSKQKSIIETGFNDKKGIVDILKDYFSWDKKIPKLFFAYIVLLIILTSLVHIPFLDSQGKLFEDNRYIENELVQDPSLVNAVSLFTQVFGHKDLEGFYQPVTMLSLMADNVIGEDVEDLTWHNRTNFILHVINVLLLYFLLVVLLKKVNIALFVSLVFALHPMAGQLILRASGRGILLGTFFGILTILFYISYVKEKNSKMSLLGIVSFILCLLSNVTFLLLPLTFVFIERCPLRIVTSKDMYRRFAIKLPFFTISLLFLIIVLISFVFNLGKMMTIGGQPFTVFFYNIYKYFTEFFVPIQLSPFFSFREVFSVYNVNVLLGIFIFIGFLIITFLAFKKWIEIFDCLGIFIALFIPVLFLVAIRPDIARVEQLYFANLGMVFLSCYLISRLWVKLSTKDFLSKNMWSFMFASVVVVVIIFLTATSLNEMKKWESNESILEYTAEKLKKNHFLYFEIAREYDKIGFSARAIDYFEEAKELGSKKALLELAFLYLDKGDNRLAGDYFSKALSEVDLDETNRIRILDELISLELYDEPIAYWEELAEERGDIKAFEELLDIYIKKDDIDNSYIYVEKILALEPDRFDLLKFAAGYNLEYGKVDKALKYAEMALEIEPEDGQLQRIVMEANIILDRGLEGGFHDEDN